MTNLLPAKIQPYVKAWLSLIGVIVSAVVLAVPEAPKWVSVVGSVVATVGVWWGKNVPAQQPPAADGTPSATSLPEKPGS